MILLMLNVCRGTVGCVSTSQCSAVMHLSYGHPLDIAVPHIVSCDIGGLDGTQLPVTRELCRLLRHEGLE